MARISVNEARKRFDLSLLLGWEEGEDVTVHEGATTLASLELEESIIVDGDLKIEGDFRSHDESGFLVVRGDLRVGTFASGGGQVIVTGSLIAEHAVHADYNHGYLHVVGDLRAKVIAAEHTVRVDGTLTGLTIDFGGFQCGDLKPDLDRQAAVYDAAKTFVDEVLDEDGGVQGPALADRLLDRQPILRDGRV